jgi:ABC-2 type transport system permease protein
MNLRPLRALIRKDLRVFLTDRRAVILSFAAPLAIASFMAFLFGGMGDPQAAGKIAIRVVDEDGTELSQKVIKAIESEKTFETAAAGREQARADVQKGKAVVAAVFPKGFGESAGRSMFGGSERPVVTLMSDPSHQAELGMVRGLLTQHIMEVVSRDAFSAERGPAQIKEALAGIDKSPEIAADDKAALKKMLDSISTWYERPGAKSLTGEQGGPGGFRMPYTTKEQTITAGNQSDRKAQYAHAFAGMVVQFILFGGIELGVGLLTERQKGLWQRVRAAPLSRYQIVAGRTLSGAIISLMTIAVVFGLGMLMFRFGIQGSLLGFLLVGVAYALAASTFGLLIAALGKTPQAARGVSIIVVLLMVMLGGAWMPTFLFPAWLQKVTPVIPTRWAVDGFEGATFRGLGFTELMPHVGALLGFAVVFATLALARFRWEAD